MFDCVFLFPVSECPNGCGVWLVPIGSPAMAHPGYLRKASGTAVESGFTIYDFTIILISVHNPAKLQALEIVLTHYPFALLFDSIQCGHQYRHQNRNNGDYDQKLN
jgi:hypothetical protein